MAPLALPQIVNSETSNISGCGESPCGLAFFEPMLVGDEAFYLELYRRGDFHRALNAPGLARADQAGRRDRSSGGEGP